MANKLFQFFLKNKTKMLHYAFELPHLNCQIIEIDNVVYNLPLQEMPSPYEVYSENNEYWLINWNEQVNELKFMDMLTNEIKDVLSVSFIGTIPHRPK